MLAMVAESGAYDVLVDRQGTLWVRDGGLWRYVCGDGLTTWDERVTLPVEFEPYRGLDRASAALVCGKAPQPEGTAGPAIIQRR